MNKCLTAVRSAALNLDASSSAANSKLDLLWGLRDFKAERTISRPQMQSPRLTELRASSAIDAEEELAADMHQDKRRSVVSQLSPPPCQLSEAPRRSSRRALLFSEWSVIQTLVTAVRTC